MISNAKEVRFWGIFWVDVSTETLTQSGFLDIASQLGIHTRTWEIARQSLANQKEPWLLVLDNADTPDVDYQQYFPSNASGVVILTSRNADCQHYATAKWINLEGLPDIKARELLLKAARVPHESYHKLEKDASIVVHLLQLHPLAIIQAGSYVSRGHCTLKDYPKVFSKQRKRLLAFRPSQAQSRYRDVYTTFEASVEMLKLSDTESTKDALDLLPILALCAPNRLPISLLFESVWNVIQKAMSEIEGNDLYVLTQWHVTHLPQLLRTESTSWDSFRLIEAIHMLETFSLVTIDRYKGYLIVFIHPLIHAWAKDRLTEEQVHENWVTAGSLFALSIHNVSFWDIYGHHLQPHLQRIVSCNMCEMFGTKPQSMICRILVNCGLQLQCQGDKNVLRLVNALCAYLGLGLVIVNPQWLGIYELAAVCQISMGKLSAAISLIRQVVMIKDQSMTANDPSILRSVRYLALLYRIAGCYKDAIYLIERVLIQQLSREESTLTTISTLHELASTYAANGQVKEAIPLLEQVLKEADSLLKEDNTYRRSIQRELSRMYLRNGQAKEAVLLLEQVVKIEEECLAGDDPDRAASLSKLAEAYVTNAQVEKALSLLEKVNIIRKETEESLIADDQRLFMSRHSIAMSYWYLGRLNESREVMQQAVELARRVFHEDVPPRVASEILFRMIQSKT